MTATITAGITPMYAAPETFEGKASHFCDQYSLAIVYQELLTGRRPFDGKNPQQLLVQHVRGTPDLAPLPLADKPIVDKALAKQAGERYARCADFVRALRQAPDIAVTLAPATPLPDQPTVVASASKSLSDATPLEPMVSLSRPSIKEPARPTPTKTPAAVSGKARTTPTKPPNGAPRSTPRWQDCWLSTPPAKEANSTCPAFHRSRHKKRSKLPAPPSGPDVPCPICGSWLVEPGPREWCGNCGYGCEMALSPLLDAEPKPVPTWSWVLLCALTVVAGLAAVCHLLRQGGLIADPGPMLPMVAGLAALGVVGVVLYLIWPGHVKPPKEVRGVRESKE
jgi:hypothetical protein